MNGARPRFLSGGHEYVLQFFWYVCVFGSNNWWIIILILLLVCGNTGFFGSGCCENNCSC